MDLSNIFYPGIFKEDEIYFNRPDCRLVKYQASETIENPEQKCSKVYYFKSGICKLSIVNESGKMFSPLRLTPGTIYPLICTDWQQNSLDMPMSIIAVTDCELIEMKPTVFASIIKEHPDLLTKVLTLSKYEERFLMYQTVSFAIKSAEKRICHTLYIISQLLPKTKHPQSLQFTQEELAEAVGISRMQATRTLRKLRNEGIIKTDRSSIRILKPDLLHDMGAI